MTEQEMSREVLEGLERIAKFFYEEDLMLRSERTEERRMISNWATSLALRIKKENLK